MLEKINLTNKFQLVNGYWSPRIIAELNGQYIKLAKFKGEMVWHSHENEDEFFQVIKGSIVIQLEEKDIHLEEGECFVVPKGVRHKPLAEEEAQVLLFEPINTAHTGTTKSNLTKSSKDQGWI